MLISAPRRSSAVPSPDGSFALYTISKYSLSEHSETKEIRVLNLKTGQTTLFSDDSRDTDPSWLKKDAIIWLRKLDQGVTEVWIGKAGQDDNEYVLSNISPTIIFIASQSLPSWQYRCPYFQLHNQRATQWLVCRRIQCQGFPSHRRDL